MSRLYLKHTLWEFVLVALASCALSYTLLNGFYVSPALQYGPLPAIIAIVCLLLLYALASSKKTIFLGGIGYAVLLFVAWVASAVATPGGGIFQDNESNYLVFCMLCTLVPTLCFLLGRTRLGAAVLFIIGAFLLGFIELFYGRFELLWAIVFIVAALALIVYKNYLQSVRDATGTGKLSFVPGFAVGLACSALALGLGAAIFFGVVAPLNPQAAQIKLITEYRALETVQVRGTSDLYQTPNLDMTSDVTNDGSRTTDDIKEDINGMPYPATGEEQTDPEDGQTNGSFLGMNLDNFEEAFDLQANPQNWPLICLLGLVVLAIAAYFVGRRILRKRRLESFQAQGANKEFEGIYLFLLDRFRRLGLTVPDGQTILEFGNSSEAATRYQDRLAGVSFKDLTSDYSKLVYGKQNISDASAAAIESYYQNFWKAARLQLGNFKYFFKSFRL